MKHKHHFRTINNTTTHNKCIVSNKNMYKTKEEVQDAIEYIMLTKNSPQLYYYLCEHCKHYHTTKHARYVATQRYSMHA